MATNTARNWLYAEGLNQTTQMASLSNATLNRVGLRLKIIYWYYDMVRRLLRPGVKQIRIQRKEIRAESYCLKCMIDIFPFDTVIWFIVNTLNNKARNIFVICIFYQVEDQPNVLSYVSIRPLINPVCSGWTSELAIFAIRVAKAFASNLIFFVDYLKVEIFTIFKIRDIGLIETSFSTFSWKPIVSIFQTYLLRFYISERWAEHYDYDNYKDVI